MSTPQFPTTSPGNYADTPLKGNQLPTEMPSRREIPLRTQFAPAKTVDFVRLMAVEARKLVNTALNRWLVIIGTALTLLLIPAWAAFMGWISKVMQDNPEATTQPAGGPNVDVLSWMTLSTTTSGVTSTFLAVLAVMSVVSEWSRRTALTTFVLEPRRARVLAAKASVITVIALGIGVLSYPLGAVATLIAQAVAGGEANWSFDVFRVLAFITTTLLSAWGGLAFGLLLMNTPAAIVLLLALPQVFGMINGFAIMNKTVADVMPWIWYDQSRGFLELGQMDTTRWWQFAVTTVIWLVVPATIGVWRWMTREAKTE